MKITPRDRPVDWMPKNKDELDAYVTDRLLAFYDGLMERAQIAPPTPQTVLETPA
jgi:hypothetical protein